ncbi:MAG: hypothetical protein JWO98_3740 [Frankiales bacterium]|nr:hypothetical protein [Frankiales bacterium]
MSTAPETSMRPPLAWELVAVLCLLFGYDRIASIANVRSAAAFRHGWAALNLERSLHLTFDAWSNQWLAARGSLGRVLSVYYDFAHGLVTFGVLLALYVWHAGGYRRARTGLLAINGLALAIFLVLPVAPPRLLPGAGFVDVVAHSGTWGAWETASSNVAEHADKFAALPSLHVAWAAWVLRVVWVATRWSWARGLAAAHLMLTALVVLATGNHFVVDVIAGVVLAEVAWQVVGLPRLGGPAALEQRLLPRTGNAAPAEADAGP